MKIKRWIEANIDVPEEFKMLKAIRIGGVGLSIGTPITLTGQQKKNLYLSKQVCYTADYDNVIAALVNNEDIIIPTSNEETNSNIYTGVELVGTKDGSNKTFTFPYNKLCKAGTEIIHINAATYLRNVGYTIENDNTVIFSDDIEAPESTDYVWADFVAL